MAAGGRKQSSQPTVIEELSQRTKLSPTIRSQGIYTYDEARPGYVSPDRAAGNNMEMLARSLSTFDRTLIPVLEQRMDRHIEEGVAAGKVLFSESAAENKNKQGWKTFTEANPEHRGNNPWLQKGYEEARLQSLGIDAEKTVNDRFVQSGMVNEKDPKKVQAWTDSTFKQVRDELGLTGYADKIMLAQHYTQLEARAKAGLLSQHSQYLKAQQEELTTQQYMDLALKMFDGAVDPSRGGGNPSDPFQAEGIMARLSGAVTTAVSQATASGVRNSKAPEIAANIYLTAYSKTNNPDILQAMLNHEVNGVKLANVPGVAAKVEDAERQRIERGRADLRHSWAVQEQNDRQMEKSIAVKAYHFALDGKPVTPEALVRAGIPDRFAGSFAKNVGTIYEGMQKTVHLSPSTRNEIATELMRAKRGETSDTEAINAFRDFGTEGKAIFDAHMEAQTEEGKLLGEHLKSGGNKVFSMMARNKDNIDLNVLTLEDTEKLSQEQKDGLAAVQVYQAGYEEAYRRLAKDNGGKVSKAQAQKLETEVMQTTLNALGKQEVVTPLASSHGGYVPPAQSANTAQMSKASVSPTLASWLETKEPGASKELVGLSDADVLAWLQGSRPDWAKEYKEKFGGNN